MHYKEKLVKEHVGLVKKISSDIYKKIKGRTSLDYDDLVSLGYIGLLQAAERYDASKNVKFTTFAYLRIKGSIYDELRSNSISILGRTTYKRIQNTLLENKSFQGLLYFNEVSRVPFSLNKKICKNENDTEYLDFLKANDCYNADNEYNKKFIVKVLKEAIDNLSKDKYKKMVILFLQGCDYIEIGKRVGYKHATVSIYFIKIRHELFTYFLKNGIRFNDIYS